MGFLSVGLFLLGSFSFGDAAISCKNMQGKDVDWFMAYKLPTATKDAAGGKAFAYLDKSNPNWTISAEPIDSLKSSIGATLGQIYTDGNDKKLMYAMWNDDPPHSDKSESYRGHIKGTIAFDAVNGFWIQHSMPNFPPAPSEGYDYPDTAAKYGQTLICVSMKTTALDGIVEQLRYMMVSAYSFNIPDSFNKTYPNLYSVIADRVSLNTRKEKVYTSKAALKTAGGQAFTSFAKHRAFNADLWRDFIAVNESVPLLVETWLNGAAKNMDSTCSTEVTVMDISTIDLNGNYFNSTKDHSKWGISSSSKRPLICVGDINRQESQMQRGGGALCIEDQKIWKSWMGIVNATKPC